MKKVLLGLLALSATLMAVDLTPIGPSQSTGVAGTAGNNQIDITTKAFIVDSGLIITETPNGNAIKSIELDHGTVLKTNPAGSTVNRDIYIRKSNYQAFPENSVLDITLQSTTNDLKNESDKVIPHALEATIESTDALATKGTQTLLLANTSQNSNNTFTTLRDAASVKINLRSDISTDVLALAEEGAYSNTSTLSVKFSKIPTVPGTSADSQPAVPLSR